MKTFYLYLALAFAFCVSLEGQSQPLASAQNPADQKVYEILKKAALKIEQNKADSAEYFLRQAGALARKLKAHDAFLEYTGRYAGFLYQHLRYKDALEISREQLELSLRLKNKQKAANAHNNMAIQYQAMGQLTTAADHFIKALKISEELNDPDNKQKFYSNLSSVFSDLNDKERSLYYARKGYQISEELRDTSRMARSLVNLTISQVLNGQLDSAIHYSLKIADIGERTGSKDLQMTACINLGDIHNKKKEYASGLAWFEKARQQLATAPPGYGVYVFMGLANSYAHLGRITRADHFYRSSISDAESELSKSELKEVYLLGAEIKEKLMQHQNALLLRKKYEALNDSLASEDTRSAIYEMEIRYQTSLKEKAIAEQALQISKHQYQLEQQNKWILVFTFAIIALAGIGLGFYMRYRHREKVMKAERKAQILQARLDGEEKERARTARELHDGVGSVLSAAKIQIYNLQATISSPHDEGYSKTYSLLDEAVKEIRNISHNLAPEIVLMEGLSYAVSRYCNRVSKPELLINHYISDSVPRLQADCELLIYRIIQEAINNIIKHSGAAQAIVQLMINGNLLSITIEDDGIGFDMNTVVSKGIGLNNLLSRIQLLNGIHEILSAPGKGTTLYLELDISRFRLAEAESSLPATISL